MTGNSFSNIVCNYKRSVCYHKYKTAAVMDEGNGNVHGSNWLKYCDCGHDVLWYEENCNCDHDVLWYEENCDGDHDVLWYE